MNRRDRPRMKKAATAGDLVQQLLQSKGLDAKLDEYRTWLIWDQTVGPQIAARARPLRLRDGVLEVRVEQAVWMQQLQLMKPKILERLNQRLEGAELKDIYLRRGRIDRSTALENRPAPALPWRKQQLTQDEQEQIEETVKGLEDPELKQALRQIFIRQQKVEKAREEKA